MARPATGSIAVDGRGESPVYRLRVRSGGRRHSVRLGIIWGYLSCVTDVKQRPRGRRV